MRAVVLATLISLAACSDPATDGYPDLLPTDQLLVEPALPPHAAADPDAVRSALRGDRSRLKAEVAAARAPGAVTPDLARRAAALRDRAAAIDAEACAGTAAADREAAGCPDPALQDIAD